MVGYKTTLCKYRKNKEDCNGSQHIVLINLICCDHDLTEIWHKMERIGHGHQLVLLQSVFSVSSSLLI